MVQHFGYSEKITLALVYIYS